MLNPKQQRFVEEYLIDLNATQAAQRAGYSKRTAYAQGPRLLKHVGIQAAVAARRAKVEERSAVTVEFVLKGLLDNFTRAMQAEPVMDHEGKATGEYTYQANAANKALELMGKYLGMFVDKVEHTFTDEDRTDRLLRMLSEQDSRFAKLHFKN